MANIWKFEVDWNEDGVFESDEGSRMINFFSRRGRDYYLREDGGGFEKYKVGTAEVTVDDYDRRFDPNNSGSPIYSDIGLRKPVKISVQDGPGGTVEGVFAGRIDDIHPLRSNPPEVKISIRGAEADLRSPATIALSEGDYADDHIGDALDDINWPTFFGRSLASGADPIPYFWCDEKSVYNLTQELANSELGTFFIDKDGQAVFRSRYDAGASVETYSEEEILRDLDIPMPWDNVYNFVTLLVYPKTIQSTAILWTAGEPIYVEAGETIPLWVNYKYENRTVPGKNVLTPVSGTDFIGNSASDGGGSNTTSDFSVAGFTSYGESGFLRMTNGGASGSYLITLQVRGDAVDTPSETTIKSDKSGASDPRVFTFNLPYQQDYTFGVSLADFLANALKTPTRIPVIEVENRFDKQFGPDIADRVTIGIASKDISAIVRKIGYIEHQWLDPNGEGVRTRLVTEPEFDLSSYWTFPTNIGTTSYFSL